MTSRRNAKQPVSRSGGSSSSSSENQSYELIPREEAYGYPNRDLPSPRVSYPFKRSRDVFEGQQGNKIGSGWNVNASEYKQQEKEYKQSIQTIKQQNIPQEIRRPKNIGDIQTEENNIHLKCEIQIQKLSAQFTELQQQVAHQREEFQLQKKANQIYNQSFVNIRQIMAREDIKLAGQSMQELLQVIEEAVRKNKNGPRFDRLVEQQEAIIRQLRAELLKSTQNNIKAIFNTEITEVQCLNLQIKKMNVEIIALEEKIYKMQSKNRAENNLVDKEQKSINEYNQNRSYGSSDDQDLYQKKIKCKQSHAKKKDIQQSKDFRQSKERSSSESNKKVRRLINTQNKVEELIDGYKLLREEYLSLQRTIRKLSENQSDYKVFFCELKTEINSSIKSQIRQLQEAIRRPSSNKGQVKMAKDLQNKLNRLINILNVPERTSLQKHALKQESQHTWIDCQQQELQLQPRNHRVQQQNKMLKQHTEQLHQRITAVQMAAQSKSTQKSQIFNPSQNVKKIASPSIILPQLMKDSPGVEKDQEVIQQLSAVQINAQAIHTSNRHELHGSLGYHPSYLIKGRIQQLHRQIQVYQQCLRQKELKIIQLQKTIMDHLQKQTVVIQPLITCELQEKYEFYINNLKILLSETRKENEALRQEMIKAGQINLSRTDSHQHQPYNTAQNPLEKTRLMRRQLKLDNFSSTQLKLKIEDELQRIFLTFLELYQQCAELSGQQRQSTEKCLMSCVETMWRDATRGRSRLFYEAIERQQVRRTLCSLGIYQQ